MASLKPKPWPSWFRELAVYALRYLDSAPPLRSVLKNPNRLSESNFEDEVYFGLRMALVVFRFEISNHEAEQNLRTIFHASLRPQVD